MNYKNIYAFVFLLYNYTFYYSIFNPNPFPFIIFQQLDYLWLWQNFKKVPTKIKRCDSVADKSSEVN